MGLDNLLGSKKNSYKAINKDERVILILSFLAYLSFGFMFQIFPPFFGALQSQFLLSKSALSLTMTIFLLPIVPTAISGGILSDRLRPKRLLEVGLGMMIIGSFISVSSGFSILLVGRGVSGIGAGLLLVSMIRMLTSGFPARKLGSAFGIFVVGLPVGTVLSFDALSPVRNVLGWKGSTYVSIAITLFTLLYAVLYLKQAGMEFKKDGLKNGYRKFAGVLRNRYMQRLSLSVLIGYMAIIAFTTWAPSELVSFGHLPLWVTSALASLLLLVDIPLSPYWGRLVDRVRNLRKPILVAAFIIYLAGSLAVPHVAVLGALFAVPLLFVTVGVMGVGCSMFQPIALTVPVNVVDEGIAGTAYGIYFTSQVSGMLLGPFILGLALNFITIGNAFLLISIITFGGLVATFLVRTEPVGLITKVGSV